MQVDTWDRILNIAFMLFWFGVWADGSREILFNPFLAPLTRWLQTALHRIRGLFFGRSDHVVCVCVLVALLAVRAVIFSAGATWILSFGFIQVRAPGGHAVLTFLFSLLSFGILLFHIWSISVFFVHSRRYSTFDNTRSALYWLSRPFSDVRVELRPAVLAAAGMLLAVGLEIAGNPGRNIVTEGGGVMALLVRTFIIALAGWASVFAILRTTLIVLIIGSWVSMFAGSQGLMMFCRHWTDTLMGPLRRYPLRIGMLDLTPIVMIYALNFVHGLLSGILLNSYTKLCL